MTATADHDSYIAAAPEGFRPSLERLRAILARALPEAEEIVAYNMPGFRIGGSVVASYAAFSKQCGLYLLPGAISEHAEEIAAAGLQGDQDRHHLLTAQTDPRGPRRTAGAGVAEGRPGLTAQPSSWGGMRPGRGGLGRRGRRPADAPAV